MNGAQRAVALDVFGGVFGMAFDAHAAELEVDPRPADAPRRAGLAPEREAELLAEWRTKG